MWQKIIETTELNAKILGLIKTPVNLTEPVLFTIPIILS
mgnify:CR=1 FL=1